MSLIYRLTTLKCPHPSSLMLFLLMSQLNGYALAPKSQSGPYFLANQNHHYDAQQAYLGPPTQTMHRAQNPAVEALAPQPAEPCPQ
ncbi:hypothetical protein BpHYR1_049902 [Brachionus plicatilis]|uniref:Uncharacterized protein n=1 Tax=Brachionus plicatilis TaxID=10195 RepID=A0A3M7QFD7_BRAPC|nr:hypothetical protein BpHYR1_049902 [Brachionus plicatilis]